jgi:hypothetical protein
VSDIPERFLGSGTTRTVQHSGFRALYRRQKSVFVSLTLLNRVDDEFGNDGKHAASEERQEGCQYACEMTRK